MDSEYLLLAGSVAVLFVVIWVHAAAQLAQIGPAVGAGNRAALPEPTPFIARAKRCVNNHIENMVLFAPLILAAGQMGAFGPMTLLGSQLFFFGRVGHAATYLAGIPWVRSLAFFVSVSGAILVFLAVLGVVR